MKSDLEPFDVNCADPSHVIIELFGGDNNLSSFVLEDLREMEAGSSANISVIALADFANEPAAVFELAPGHPLRIVERPGEIDTGDPDTLATFVARALRTYGSSTRKALGFWDHGSGTFDEQDDDELILQRRLARVPRQRRSRSFPARKLLSGRIRNGTDTRAKAMLHDDTSGGVLTNLEAGAMLRAAFERAGFEGQLDLLFSDTCLNGMVEVVTELAGFAQCIVGSEELEPGDGWDYEEWLRRSSAEPPADGDAWGAQAVEAFEAGYRDRPFQHPCTLGAFRTDGAIPAAFRGLVSAAREHAQGFQWLNTARTFTQSFARRDTYDIHDFAERLLGLDPDAAVADAAQQLVTEFGKARVTSTALGDDVPDSHGLAFWFPSSRTSFRKDAATYARLAFARESGWCDYLREIYD